MSQSFEFEAWFDREFPMDASGGRPKYRETMVMDLMRASWNASRREALKEAAAHVETLGLVFFFGEQEFAKTGRACTADAIRALSKDQTT